MLSIVIQVENSERKTSFQRTFRKSPVRIGRSDLNDLVLPESFVSLWHAMVRFDANGFQYMDLGSTNGSEIDGHRAKSNAFISLGEKTDLRICSLKLHLSRSEAGVSAGDEPDARSLTLFGRATEMNLPSLADRLPKPGSLPTTLSKTEGAVSPVMALRDLQEKASPGTIASQFFLLYENYRKSWKILHSHLIQKVLSLPADKREATLQVMKERMPELTREPQFSALFASPGLSPEKVAATVLVQQPESSSPTITVIAQQPATEATPPPESIYPDASSLDALKAEFSAQSASDNASSTVVVSREEMAAMHATPKILKFTFPAGKGRAESSPGSDSRSPQLQEVPSVESTQPTHADDDDGLASLSLLRLFAQTYASDVILLESTQQVQNFLGQLSAVLEGLIKSFFELSHGHDQLGKEIAVPMAGDQSALRHAKTPKDVLRFLLDCSEQGTERIQALTQSFADVMIQQVAFLGGVREGITALLAHLSPDSLAGKATGLKQRVFAAKLFRGLSLWNRYEHRYRDLIQEDRAVHAIVFGPEFAKAYAQIVGAQAVQLGKADERATPRGKATSRLNSPRSWKIRG